MYTILSNYPAKIKKGIQQLLMEGKKVLEPFQNTVDTGIGLFARLYNDASSLLPLLQWVGKVDVYTSIASLKTICFPRWTTDTTEFTNIYHPMLKNPILNTVSLQPHAILTGPNRGGKSTICKAIGLSIVCAQSWGFAFASKASLTPFARIETALSPADTIGRLSLFETEIEFAKTVVEAAERPLFVMMDEIFHSTNAHDGVEASRVFLNRLYKLPNTVSLISTHYRVLAEEYKTVQSLQVEAIPTDNGLKYTYQVIPGISTKSSVMEILQERGLLCAEQSSV
jgi:DNA mismatch repair ATPase MutS